MAAEHEGPGRRVLTRIGSAPAAPREPGVDASDGADVRVIGGELSDEQMGQANGGNVFAVWMTVGFHRPYVEQDNLY